MSDETVTALLAKRTELAETVQKLPSTIFHIDATLAVFGYKPGVAHKRRFADGELIALIGEAERTGVTTANGIARWVVKRKELHADNKLLAKRALFSVKDGRKRLNARGM